MFLKNWFERCGGTKVRFLSCKGSYVAMDEIDFYLIKQEKKKSFIFCDVQLMSRPWQCLECHVRVIKMNLLRCYKVHNITLPQHINPYLNNAMSVCSATL